MQTTQVVKTATRVPVRPILLAIVVVALAMAGLALLAEAMTGGGGGTVYLANINSGSKGAVSQPVVEVVGYGVASAPAERAVIQVLIVRDSPFGDDAQPTSASGTSTPTSSRNRDSMTPLIDSLMAIGVDEEDVFVLTSPSLISVCNNYSRCSSARIDVTVDQPTLDRINAIVNSIGSEAAQSGMTIQDVGVGYAIADCNALTLNARQLATTDAQKRATEQAGVLQVNLGKLLVSSELAPTTPRDATGCSILQTTFGDSWWTAGSSGLTVPAFNPSAPAEASVTVQVLLAYAISDGRDQTI